MAKARPRVRAALETRTLPLQARSRSTFDAILNFAGETLADAGSRTFSINAVCERAGLTPPAVYRYFPNKYALLKALAERLMQAEDEAALAFMVNWPIPRSEGELIAEVRKRVGKVVAVTSSFPGSVAILRTLRTTPVMREIRAASTTQIAVRWFARLRQTFPNADPGRLQRGALLGLEISTRFIELIVEGEIQEPGEGGNDILDEVAVMLGRFYWHLGSTERPILEGRKRMGLSSTRERG